MKFVKSCPQFFEKIRINIKNLSLSPVLIKGSQLRHWTQILQSSWIKTSVIFVQFYGRFTRAVSSFSKKRGNYFVFSMTTAGYKNERIFSRLHHSFISFIRCSHPEILRRYGGYILYNWILIAQMNIDKKIKISEISEISVQFQNKINSAFCKRGVCNRPSTRWRKSLYVICCGNRNSRNSHK